MFASDAIVIEDSTATDFEPGDVVALISGGPRMTVLATCECGNVEVAWFDEDYQLYIEMFPEEALIDA